MQRTEINCVTGEVVVIDMSAEEVAALPILPPEDPKALIREQIKQLEQAQLMPRATREFMLLYVETNNLTAMPGYAPLKAFDNQIVALRNQL